MHILLQKEGMKEGRKEGRKEALYSWKVGFT
jgi:hypothetical protein